MRDDGPDTPAMTTPPTDLTSLVAPLAAEDFLARWYERRWAHLVDASRGPMVTLDAVCEAAREGWRDGAVEVFAEHFDGGRHAPGDVVGDRARLDDYLAAGHPLVWRSARRRFPAVDRLCAALARALGARVWPNVYVTGTAGTPFDMHFDAHEVFVVHCEGAKEWTLSNVRADRPTDDDPQRDVMAARREEAEADVAARFVVAPGEVVYVPRGVFHNARAVGGTSVHVTFGVRGLTGHDVARVLAARALGDPALRGFAPSPAGDYDAWLREVLVRLGEHLFDEGFDDDVRAAREVLVRGG